MARRNRLVYAPEPRVSIPAHPVIGPMVTVLLTVVAVVVLVVTIGPIADYFSAYLSSMPDGASGYANPVLQMFVQWYWLVMLAIGCSVAAGFLAIIRYITYSRYGD